MNLDCLTLGEPLICFDSMGEPLDCTATVRKYAAGAESNLAIGLARLGHSVGTSVESVLIRADERSCARCVVKAST